MTISCFELNHLPVEDGDTNFLLELGAIVPISLIFWYAVASHTKGHISYYVTGKGDEDPAVFTGDTLFIAGCGKIFEGTAEQMYQSLCVTLGSLPKPTRVYCGHEYTVKNLLFALTVEQENAKIKQKLSWAQQQQEKGLPTIPSTIEEEMETNPFMRVDLPELQEIVGCKSPVECLREIRQRKDKWRGWAMLFSTKRFQSKMQPNKMSLRVRLNGLSCISGTATIMSNFH